MIDILITVHHDENAGTLSYKLDVRNPHFGLVTESYPNVELSRESHSVLDVIFETIGESPTSAEDEEAWLEVRRRLEGIGERVFVDLVPTKLHTHLRKILDVVRGADSAPILQIRSDETFVPWELLRIPGRPPERSGAFLAEAFCLTRWLLDTQTDREEVVVLPLSEIALVVAQRSGLPCADEEKKLVRSLADRDRCVTEVEARYAAVTVALDSGRYDGWHFTGHGVKFSERMGFQALHLDTGELTAYDLRPALSRGSTPPLVFANACHSGRSSPGLTRMGGLARAFLESGAGAYIGSHWAIADTSACDFARAFYDSFLGKHLSIGESIRQARLTIRDSGGATWLAYTVFAHPQALCQPLPCPYVGLKNFDEADTERFFGREKEIDAIVSSLHAGTRFLTLLGASGAGKSSLVLAGILPALRCGAAGIDWRIVRLQPTARPVRELAIQLVHCLGGEIEAWKKGLQNAPEGLADHLELALRKHGHPAGRVLLVVDQFEELFTQADADERHAFLISLLHAVHEPNGRVAAILTLRADFLGKALDSSRELAEAIRESQEILLPMDSDSLRIAIGQPAAELGVRFEDGLLDILVHELEGQPGDLPLLQFTLDRLWSECEGRCLTWAGYRRIGELRGAISRFADDFFFKLELNDREMMRRIFCRLIHLGDNSEDTRRRAERNDLDTIGSKDLVEKLIKSRLLTAQRDGVELAHEALIRKWPRLRTWIEKDRERIRLLQELAQATTQWERDNRSRDNLWRGVRLERISEFVHQEKINLTCKEIGFLNEAQSVAELKYEAEINRRRMDWEKSKELERVRSQAKRRRSLGILFVSIFLFLTIVFAITSNHSRRIAAVERAMSDSGNLLHSNLDISLLIALEVYNERRNEETIRGLATGLTHNPFIDAFLHGHSEYVMAVEFSPSSGDIVVSGSKDGEIILWSLSQRRIISRIREPLVSPSFKMGPDSLAFSPDGRWLAYPDESIRLWDFKLNKYIDPIDDCENCEKVSSLAFSATDPILVSNGSEASLMFWDTETWNRLNTPSIPEIGGASAIAFSSNGELLAVGSYKECGDGASQGPDIQTARNCGCINLLRVTNQVEYNEKKYSVKLIDKWCQRGEQIFSLDFDRHNRLIASGWRLGTVRIWDLENARHTTLGKHSFSVNKVRFSPDGKQLASSSWEDRIIIWKLAEPSDPLELSGHGGGSVASIDFSHDGQALVSAGENDRVLLWNLELSSRGSKYRDYSAGIKSIVFNTRGRIFTSSSDGIISSWNPFYNEDFISRKVHSEEVALAINSEEDILVSGDNEGQVRFWHANTLSEIEHLGEDLVREGSSRVRDIKINPRDGSVVVTLDGGKNLQIWSDEEPGPRFKEMPRVGPALYVDFNQDGSLLAASYESGRITLWETQTWTALKTALYPDSFIPGGISFNRKGDFVAMRGRSGIEIWDVRTFQVIYELVLHETVTHHVFGPSENQLIVGYADGSVVIWDLDTRFPAAAPLMGHAVGPIAVASGSGQSKAMIASADRSGKVVVWDLDSLHSFEKKSCDIANRNLTPKEWSSYLDWKSDYRPTCKN